jgi:hypothetical protein
MVGKIKALILLNLALAWACFTWFTLIILGYAPGTLGKKNERGYPGRLGGPRKRLTGSLPSHFLAGNKTSIYISLLGAGLFINTPIPLFFELALETAYPEIQEGSAASLLSLSSTLMQVCENLLLGHQLLLWPLLLQTHTYVPRFSFWQTPFRHKRTTLG